MATVLTTKFITTEIPFSGKKYKCITYNSELYIFVNYYGIYKYDYVNKIFSTVLVDRAITHNCVLYGNSVIFVRSYYIDNSNMRAVFQLSKYNFENNTITNFLTVNGTLRTEYVTSSSDWRNTIYIGDLHKKNSSLYISWTGNYIYPSTGQIGRNYNELIEVNLTNLSYEGINTNFAHYCTYDEYFFSGASAIGINTFQHYKVYGEGSSSVSYNFDLFGGCCFASEQYYYLLGGVNNPKQIIRFNTATKNFELSEGFSLPQDTVNLNVGEYYDSNNNYIIFYDDGIFIITEVNYNLTYTIFDTKGNIVLAQITNQSPITTVKFSSDDGVNIGYLFNTLSGISSGSFVVQKIEGKRLIGFSTSKNATKASFIINTETTIYIDENVSFYAVYETYRPPTTTFEVNLYKNSAEFNRVDKTNYLESVGFLKGVLRDQTSILNMSLTIEYPKVPDFNYVYIPAFNRYYYVDDIVSVNNKLWAISLSVDVLMSHKNKLLKCTGFIDRNEKTFDSTIIDTLRPVQQGQNIKVYQNNINYVFGNTGSYILTGSVLGMTNIKTRIYFDSGVTVTVKGTNIESGAEYSPAEDPEIKITSTKAKTYINNVLRTATSTINIDGGPSIYIKTSGSDVNSYEITVNWIVT